jgi:hypothetical protein
MRRIERMQTRPKPVELAVGFAGAWIAGALLIATISGPWMANYASSGVWLSEATRNAVLVCEVVRSPVGWIVLFMSLSLGLIPMYLDLAGAAYRRFLVFGVIHAVLATSVLWAALELPLLLQVRRWNETGNAAVLREEGIRGVITEAGLALAPAMVTAALLQLASWVALSRRVFRLPRADNGEEALRALILAVVPALGAALIAFFVAAKTRTTLSANLLVSPPVAAAGTVMLLVYSVALWLRIRSAP